MANGTNAIGRAGRAAAVASVCCGLGALVASLFVDGKVRSAGLQSRDLVDAVAFVAAWASSTFVGATLLVRRPSHPVGWLFGGLGLTVAIWAVSESYGLYGVVAGRSAFVDVAAVVSNSVFIPAFVLIAAVCALTPDGRFLTARWRTASVMMVGTASAWLGLRLISPQPLERPFEAVDNPWAVASFDSRLVRLVAAVATSVSIVAAVVSLVVRFVRAEGEVRRQLLWLAVAAVVLPVLLAVSFVAAVTDNDVLLSASTTALIVSVPVSAGLAVSRYHLYDVDRILSRAVAYVVVSGCVVTTYAAVGIVVAFAVDQAVTRSPVATSAATLAAAAIARPAYTRVRDKLDRGFQRRRYHAVRQVRAYVADPPPERSIEAVLQEALADPGLRVAYWDDARTRWISEDGRGADVEHIGAVTVARSGRAVAVVSTRCEDETTLQAVLDEAAPELDNVRLRAAVAVQLEEVRASRERLVDAQVDERRRIERNLHDGAQQRLLGVAAHMQAALLNGSAERLVAALELGVRESRATVAELRALANGLHPAVLENGGLVAALADLSSRLPITLAVDGSQRRHAPLVESTLWFVACEAISNAVKHADARRICVLLTDADDELRLVVEDDGRGGAKPSGNGLRGMADRVDAAGGHLTITSNAGSGTRIDTVLPCGW